MYLSGIAILLGFAVGWYWAKSHYTEQAKMDMDYKLNEIARTSPEELEDNIQKAKDDYQQRHGSYLDFKPTQQLENDPAGSWYLHHMKLQGYQSVLRKNGWKKES